MALGLVSLRMAMLWLTREQNLEMDDPGWLVSFLGTISFSSNCSQKTQN